jgi:hypothetical protein
VSWSRNCYDEGGTEIKTDMRYFTLIEANRALVLVSPIVGDILIKRRKLIQLEHRLRERHSRRGSRSPLSSQRSQHELQRLIRDMEYHMEELHSIGCELRDVHRGITDFPSWYRGRVIHLCWQPGEEQVTHWHEQNAGFSKRQRVDDSFRPHVSGVLAM